MPHLLHTSQKILLDALAKKMLEDAPKTALINQEQRFRLLIDAVVDYAIYMTDPSGIITSWNSGARRFKGYEESEILGQHFSRFYTDQDRADGLPQRALDTALREGRFEGEGWRVRKDGTLFWSHVVIDPIIDSQSGDLLGFAKITRDLTDRKMAEETLKQSEQQFRLLVQSVTDYAIYMLDPDGQVTNWNLGAQRIKGYLPAEAIGRHFSMFYTPEDREAGEPQRALSIAASEGRFEKRGWRLRKDGTRFMAHVVIDAIRSDTGRYWVLPRSPATSPMPPAHNKPWNRLAKRCSSRRNCKPSASSPVASPMTSITC